MIHISIMRFDKEVQKFRVFGLDIFALDVIPRIGEKIIFDDEVAIIAEVIDIHYSVSGDIDIYIGHEMQYRDYLNEMNDHTSTLN